jgi:hypothetical protein
VAPIPSSHCGRGSAFAGAVDVPARMIPAINTSGLRIGAWSQKKAARGRLFTCIFEIRS